MALYIVIKENPYFPVTAWVECLDHGCQLVERVQEGNKAKMGRARGVAIPYLMLKQFIIKPQKRGCDVKISTHGRSGG